MLHEVPTLLPVEGRVTSESLVTAYIESVEEIKMCNIDKQTLREWGS